MLHAAASDGVSTRDIWWIHSARDGAHHSFASQARGLLAPLRNGRHCNIYSRPNAVDRLGLDYDRQGHVTGPLLQQLGIPRDADFYLCGPSRYLADLQAVLQAWGVEGGRVHREVFGPVAARTPGMVGGERHKPHMPAGVQGAGPLVSFTRSGLGVRWDARFNSLLELAEACSVPVRWSCRTGVCHNCESGLIEGRLRYSPEPLDPPSQGVALICCSTPMSDVTLDL
jgi:ferredoxin